MTKLIRRMLLLAWVLLGPLLMTYVFSLMKQAIFVVSGDELSSSFIAVYAVAAAFCIVGYSITELPVTDK